MIRLAVFFLLLTVFSFALSPLAWAQTRNASFVDPASAAKTDGKAFSSNANTLVADPAQTDAGETLVNVARRVTVFFYNGFRTAIQLTQLTLNADGNVRSKVLSDDCKTIQNLPPQDRCSIVMEIVPSSPGPWSVELLLNHSGQGRIARAEITGTTLGKTDEKAEGLAVSKKISAPLDFGKVRPGQESVARTMLIENDSPEPLVISSVDLIARDDQGLRLRSVGCKEGDELQPGESCPITVMWEPETNGNIATDLIVRHSGGLGFVVVPIRGNADGGEEDKGGVGRPPRSSGASLAPKSTGESYSQLPGSSGTIPMGKPPTVSDVAKTMPVINANQLLKSAPGANETPWGESDQMLAPAGAPAIALIGTVNGRAILGDANNQTYVVGLGESTAVNGVPVALLQLEATRAVVSVAGTRQELSLRRAPAVAVRGSSGLGSKLGESGTGGGTSEKSLVPLPSVAPAPATSPTLSPGGALGLNPG